MDHILVAGGTGFIGTHLVNRLARQGFKLRVLSRNRPTAPVSGVEYIVGDYLDERTQQSVVQGINTIFHLVSSSVPGSSNEHIIYDARTNMMGTLGLTHAASDAKVNRFIFLSSGGSVYGVTPREPVNEDYPNVPISAHGASKVAVTAYLGVFKNISGMEYRVARVANPFGEHQLCNKAQGFIAHALNCIKNNREIEIWGDGSVVRDFFYVDDLIDALLLLRTDQSAHTIYNIGSGEGRSLRDIIATLEQVTGRKAKVRYDKARSADVPYNCLSIARAKSSLGWEPKTPLLDGIKKHWQWVLDQNI